MASTTEKDVAVDHRLNGKLYNALLKKRTKEVKEYCEGLPDHALHKLSLHRDTVLHTATYSKQAKLVLALLKDFPDHHRDNLTRQNSKGNTILHEVATLHKENPVEVARVMLEKAPGLLRMTNELGETALFRAARYGNTHVFDFLAKEMQPYDEATQREFIQREDKTTILHAAVLARHCDLALKIAQEFGHIVDERNKDGMTALQLLSCNPSAFEPLRSHGLLKIGSSSVKNALSKDRRKEKANCISALELAKLLVERDTSWASIQQQKDASSGSDGPSTENRHEKKDEQVKKEEITPLFLATESGCVEIVKEILKIYPQAVMHLDGKGRTILHIAIMHRQLEVYNHVLKMKVAKRWLVRRLDNDGNTILHMVGIRRMNYVSQKFQSPALELQAELQWFERVKSITVSHFVDHRNKRNETAEDLFATNYKGLREEAREWLKRTGEGCSLVAILIATVAFAAAYTIPGGPNQNTGLPVLHGRPFFVVFVAADVLSLACALTSVVLFLSILTAPFKFNDFKHSLPNKLMLGFTFLFHSVLMMMIAFAATIILLMRRSERWTKIMLYTFTLIPVGIFALSYLPLYVSLSETYTHLLEKMKQAIPWNICPLGRYCSQPQSTDSTNHESEGRDLDSSATPQNPVSTFERPKWFAFNRLC